MPFAFLKQSPDSFEPVGPYQATIGQKETVEVRIWNSWSFLCPIADMLLEPIISLPTQTRASTQVSFTSFCSSKTTKSQLTFISFFKTATGGICGNLPPDAITRTTKTKTTSTSSTSKTRLSSTSKTKYTTLTTLSSTTRAITTITEVPDGGSTNASTSQSYLAVAGSNTTVELALPATCAYQCFIYGFVGASNGAPLVSVFFAASNGSLARRQVASQPQEFARGSAGKIDFTFAVDNFEWALTQVCSSDAILAGKCKVVATVGDPAHWSAGTITLLASLQRLDSPAALSELRISQAISTGDSSLVTGNELRSAIASAASSQAVANNALITTIWSSPINLSASKIYWMLFDETIREILHSLSPSCLLLHSADSTPR